MAATANGVGSTTRRGRGFTWAPREGEEGRGVREGRRRRRLASGAGVRRRGRGGDEEDGSDGGVAPGGGEVLLPRSRSSRGRGGYFRGGGEESWGEWGMGLGFLVVGGGGL